MGNIIVSQSIDLIKSGDFDKSYIHIWQVINRWCEFGVENKERVLLERERKRESRNFMCSSVTTTPFNYYTNFAIL